MQVDQATSGRPGSSDRVLLGTQLLFNLGFYAVVPFLALVLTEDFALGGAAVGLVLGIRTFSQQGMFLLGGMLADRFGARTLILSGCAVRCLGFLTLSASLWSTDPALSWFVVGTVLTGLGGAMFSPALNTLVAAAETRRTATPTPGRRVTLFAWLSVVGETGAAVGPLLGAALLGWGFATVAASGAALFAAIGLGLWLRLPAPQRPTRPPTHPAQLSTRGGGRPASLRDRGFVAFALIHAVDLFAYNQLYLALPTELRRVEAGPMVLGLLLAWVSILTVTLQIAVARRSSRLSTPAALRLAYLLSACGFLVLAGSAPWNPAPGWELVPAAIAVTLFTTSHLLALPTGLAAVTTFAGTRPTGSYFGLLATTGGITVLVGNLGVGALLDLAAAPQPAAAVPWLVLATLPILAATAIGTSWIWERPRAAAPDLRPTGTGTGLVVRAHATNTGPHRG